MKRFNKNPIPKWTQSEIHEGDNIMCNVCHRKHELSEGTVNNMRIGDGVLLYSCGDRVFIGAINYKTAFGVNRAI
jgi:hypothetical protein